MKKINPFSPGGQTYFGLAAFAAWVVAIIIEPDWAAVAMALIFGSSFLFLYSLKCPGCGVRAHSMTTFQQKVDRNLIFPPECPNCQTRLWGLGVDY